MDVWQYIYQENIPLPKLYFSHQREVIVRDGALISTHPEWVKVRPNETPKTMTVRFRTCGDLPITGAVESDADTVEKIIYEVATTRVTERGSRADDKRSETSMEDRKKAGYF